MNIIYLAFTLSAMESHGRGYSRGVVCHLFKKDYLIQSL